MANSNDPEGTEEKSTEGEESSVIKGLRDQHSDDAAELKELRLFREESETQAELASALAAEGFVNTLGFPGLKEDVIGWVEGVPTLENVTEALQTRGLLTEEKPATTPVVEPETTETKAPSTSKLGQEVANAASGEGVKGVDERLAAADSVAEVNVIMTELDAVRDYT